MGHGQKKLTFVLLVAAGALAALAAATQFWRTGTVEFGVVGAAVVFVVIGLGIRPRKT